MSQVVGAGQTVDGKIVALQVDDQGRLQTSGGGGGGTADGNNKVGVTAADTTPDFLGAKTVAGAGITLTVTNPGANERLNIAAIPPAASPNNKAGVTAADTTPDFLNGKLVAGANVTLTVTNPGANEKLTVAAVAPVAPSFPPEDDAGNVTGAANVSLAASLTRRLTLTGNATITLTGLVASKAQWFQLKVIQGGAGSFTLAIVGAKKPGGTALALSTAVGAQDIISGYWDGATIYASVAGLAFA